MRRRQRRHRGHRDPERHDRAHRPDDPGHRHRDDPDHRGHGHRRSGRRRPGTWASWPGSDAACRDGHRAQRRADAVHPDRPHPRGPAERQQACGPCPGSARTGCCPDAACRWACRPDAVPEPWASRLAGRHPASDRPEQQVLRGPREPPQQRGPPRRARPRARAPGPASSPVRGAGRGGEPQACRQRRLRALRVRPERRRRAPRQRERPAQRQPSWPARAAGRAWPPRRQQQPASSLREGPRRRCLRTS